MVTITLMGQLQTADGERTLACEITDPLPVKRLIQLQGQTLREIFKFMREKKVMITINRRIASEDSPVQDGDTINLVAHDGMGRSGLTPSLF